MNGFEYNKCKIAKINTDLVFETTVTVISLG